MLIVWTIESLYIPERNSLMNECTVENVAGKPSTDDKIRPLSNDVTEEKPTSTVITIRNEVPVKERRPCYCQWQIKLLFEGLFE